MKSLIINHSPVIKQQPHAQLQMLARIYVFGHDIVVRSVQQQLAEELYRLSFDDVVLRLDEHAVVFGEELVKVGLEVGCYHFFVADEDFLNTASDQPCS